MSITDRMSPRRLVTPRSHAGTCGTGVIAGTRSSSVTKVSGTA